MTKRKGRKPAASKCLVRMPRRGKPERRRNPQTLSPADRKELALARRVSQEFHGRAEVVELSPRERKRPPRFAVLAGKLTALAYKAPRGSSKAGAEWEHESGDRGPFRKPATAKPALVVDPKTRKPIIVADRSPMKLTGRGFEG